MPAISGGETAKEPPKEPPAAAEPVLPEPPAKPSHLSEAEWAEINAERAKIAARVKAVDAYKPKPPEAKKAPAPVKEPEVKPPPRVDASEKGDLDALRKRAEDARRAAEDASRVIAEERRRDAAFYVDIHHRAPEIAEAMLAEHTLEPHVRAPLLSRLTHAIREECSKGFGRGRVVIPSSHDARALIAGDAELENVEREVLGNCNAEKLIDDAHKGWQAHLNSTVGIYPQRKRLLALFALEQAETHPHDKAFTDAVDSWYINLQRTANKTARARGTLALHSPHMELLLKNEVSGVLAECQAATRAELTADSGLMAYYRAHQLELQRYAQANEHELSDALHGFYTSHLTYRHHGGGALLGSARPDELLSNAFRERFGLEFMGRGNWEHVLALLEDHLDHRSGSAGRLPAVRAMLAEHFAADGAVYLSTSQVESGLRSSRGMDVLRDLIDLYRVSPRVDTPPAVDPAPRPVDPPRATPPAEPPPAEIPPLPRPAADAEAEAYRILSEESAPAVPHYEPAYSGGYGGYSGYSSHSGGSSSWISKMEKTVAQEAKPVLERVSGVVETQMVKTNLVNGPYVVTALGALAVAAATCIPRFGIFASPVQEATGWRPKSEPVKADTVQQGAQVNIRDAPEVAAATSPQPAGVTP